jgi:hypothetical protein
VVVFILCGLQPSKRKREDFSLPDVEDWGKTDTRPRLDRLNSNYSISRQTGKAALGLKGPHRVEHSYGIHIRNYQCRFLVVYCTTASIKAAKAASSLSFHFHLTRVATRLNPNTLSFRSHLAVSFDFLATSPFHPSIIVNMAPDSADHDIDGKFRNLSGAFCTQVACVLT